LAGRRAGRPGRVGRGAGRQVHNVDPLLHHQGAAAGGWRRGLLRWSRGHGTIENRSHDVRDVSLGEGASRISKGSGPEVMAALRDPSIGSLRSTGAHTIAEAMRRNAARVGELFTKLGIFSLGLTLLTTLDFKSRKWIDSKMRGNDLVAGAWYAHLPHDSSHLHLDVGCRHRRAVLSHTVQRRIREHGTVRRWGGDRSCARPLSRAPCLSDSKPIANEPRPDSRRLRWRSWDPRESGQRPARLDHPRGRECHGDVGSDQFAIPRMD
jgi:hypothetical protein